MAEKRFIAGDRRDVVWSECRDAGDMFSAEVGVWREGDAFVAYVQGGWGGGIKSGRKPDEAAARSDIGRLWEKFYG